MPWGRERDGAQCASPASVGSPQAATGASAAGTSTGRPAASAPAVSGTSAGPAASVPRPSSAVCPVSSRPSRDRRRALRLPSGTVHQAQSTSASVAPVMTCPSLTIVSTFTADAGAHRYVANRAASGAPPRQIPQALSRTSRGAVSAITADIRRSRTPPRVSPRRAVPPSALVCRHGSAAAATRGSPNTLPPSPGPVARNAPRRHHTVTGSRRHSPPPSPGLLPS